MSSLFNVNYSILQQGSMSLTSWNPMYMNQKSERLMFENSLGKQQEFLYFSLEVYYILIQLDILLCLIFHFFFLTLTWSIHSFASMNHKLCGCDVDVK